MVVVIYRYTCQRVVAVGSTRAQAQDAHPSETIIDQEVDDHCEGDIYGCYTHVRLCHVKFNVIP